MECSIRPRLATLNKLDPRTLSKAMYVLNLLTFHKFEIVRPKYTHQRSNPEVRIDRDRKSHRHLSRNFFAPEEGQELGPELSLMMMMLADFGVSFDTTGIYILQDDLANRVKIARFYIGETNVDVAKLDSPEHHCFAMDVTVSNARMMKDFERLDRLVRDFFSLSNYGQEHSSQLGGIWLLEIEWELLLSEDWVVTHTRAISNQMAYFQAAHVQCETLRRERNNFYTGQRIVRAIDEMDYVSPQFCYEMLNRLKEYAVIQNPQR